jgi:hypothetical protein
MTKTERKKMTASKIMLVCSVVCLVLAAFGIGGGSVSLALLGAAFYVAAGVV